MKRVNVSSGSPYEPSVGFSRAVRKGNTVVVAGTAPIGEDGKPASVGNVEGQARRCLEIIRAALEAAGATMDDVVRTRSYLVNASDSEAVGKVHGEYFGDIRPASTMVVVSALLEPEWLVEIEADAIVDSI